jgi:hypothetical protein
VRPDDVRSASYLVWLGTGRTPSPVRLGWTAVDKPVLVCGMPPLEAGAWAGVNGLRKFPPKPESFPSSRITLGRAVIPTPVSYAIAAKAEGEDARTFAEIATTSGTQTLAWQSGNVFWFPALPLEQGVGVALVGHRDPGVVAAAGAQSGRLLHAMGDAFPDVLVKFNPGAHAFTNAVGI